MEDYKIPYYVKKKYSIEKKLGEGSFGEVYLANSKDGYVVLKFIFKEKVREKDIISEYELKNVLKERCKENLVCYHKLLQTDDTYVLVMDFMNSNKVIDNLVVQEEKEVDDILFHINRSFDGRFIFKDIRFNDNGKSFHFQERVSALKKDDFIHLLTSNGFIIDAIYGDFELNVYDDSVSDRLILIAKKNG